MSEKRKPEEIFRTIEAGDFYSDYDQSVSDLGVLRECLVTRPAPTVEQAARVLLESCPNPVFDQLKPVLMGEFSVSIPEFDEDGDEYFRNINIPWVDMKEIIHHALRALAGGKDHE